MIDSGRVDVLIIIDENKIFEVDDDIKNELIALLKKKADNVITDFPKADVREVKHGKWIEEHDWIRCGICGFEIKDEYYEKRLQYKGCPNCLSVMDIK